MWPTVCPECGERMRKASIELQWDKPTAAPSGALAVYQHFAGPDCSAPATSENIDNLIGEPRAPCEPKRSGLYYYP